MNAREFVASIRKVVVDAAVVDTIAIVQRPPGRRPDVDLVELSVWYDGLEEADRDMIRRLLGIVAHHAVFGLFAVLDGARMCGPSEDPQDYFELRHVHGASQDVLSGPNGEILHELL